MDAVSFFLNLSLWVRVGVVLVTLLMLLIFLHKPILFILSLIPYLLKTLFRIIYWFLEWPVFILHKLLGGIVYGLSNFMSTCGEAIDTRLDYWYKAWHTPKSMKPYVIVILLGCMICYAAIVGPSFFHMEEDDQLSKGWTVYLHTEDAVVHALADYGWYTPEIPTSYPVITEPEETQDTVQIPLTVYRVSNVLRIRDTPSTQGSETLDSLKSGEVVIWNGELTFGLAEGTQEPWVKVITESGIEGWGRLFYLRPEEDAELTLTIASILESN